MNPVHFPEANVVFKKPEGWTDEQCSDLHVHAGDVVLDSKGNIAANCFSCWEPTREEAEAEAMALLAFLDTPEGRKLGTANALLTFIENRKVWLGVIGGQPPVSVSLIKPI